MTIQLHSLTYGTSKTTLRDALNADPHRMVCFYDPSIFSGSRGIFAATDMRLGEEFCVVMDPASRRRFAFVKRVREDLWSVK